MNAPATCLDHMPGCPRYHASRSFSSRDRSLSLRQSDSHVAVHKKRNRAAVAEALYTSLPSITGAIIGLKDDLCIEDILAPWHAAEPLTDREINVAAAAHRFFRRQSPQPPRRAPHDRRSGGSYYRRRADVRSLSTAQRDRTKHLGQDDGAPKVGLRAAGAEMVKTSTTRTAATRSAPLSRDCRIVLSNGLLLEVDCKGHGCTYRLSLAWSR